MESEAPAALTIIAIGYRARCNQPTCGNLAHAILRYADQGGRPLSNLELCMRHAREATEIARQSGLTVSDQRKS